MRSLRSIKLEVMRLETMLENLQKISGLIFSYKSSKSGMVYKPDIITQPSCINLVKRMRKLGLSDLEIAKELNRYEIPSFRTNQGWTADDVFLLSAMPDIVLRFLK